MAERSSGYSLLPPEEAGDHDKGLDVGVRGGELPQQGDVMEGFVIVEEGDDAQADCAQQEYPVPPHFHPGKRGNGESWTKEHQKTTSFWT